VEEEISGDIGHFLYRKPGDLKKGKTACGKEN
jgi:hypothetical protein